jgi:hypothetical protein
MQKLYIATDQHHKHGMERIIQQFGFDKRYFFLGDITPYREDIEESGKQSKDKAGIKKLQKQHPDYSYEEVVQAYIEEDIPRALERFGKGIPYTLARLRFLKENKVNLQSISGNIDILMDFILKVLCEKTDFGVPTTLDLIKAHPWGEGFSFIDYPFPLETHDGGWVDNGDTHLVRLPYSEKCDLSKYKPFVTHKAHSLILTHENPHPEGVGEHRPAKMQESIDEVIDKTRSMCTRHVVLACGHLHVSGDPYEYRGATVVPLGPDDVMEYDLEKGDFKVTKADNH